MNVIYIKKEDKENLVSKIKQYLFDYKYSNKISNEVSKLLFIKQNKKINDILIDLFPTVLVSIITNYCIEYIKTHIHFTKLNTNDNRFEYAYSQYNLHIKIPKYKYMVTISFIEMPLTSFYKKDDIVCDKYLLSSKFNYNQFDIDDYLDPFIIFNNFMLKYYNKKKYFNNFIPNKFRFVRKKYKNTRQMKYCIIITKIITEIIQNIN